MAKKNNTTAQRRVAAAARRAGGANGAKVAGNRSFGTFANNTKTAAGRVINARRAGGGGIGDRNNPLLKGLRAARRAGRKVVGGGRNG